jgi:GT2 family glycosyltransferase
LNGEMADHGAVAVCIVTYGSASDLPACLAAVVAQDYRPLELVVVDCASDDESVDVARGFDMQGIAKRVIPLHENRGFAGGMNEAFAHTKAPYVLTLNADAVLASGYVSCLLDRLRTSAPYRLGALTGRLVRPVEGTAKGAAKGATHLLDACGMFLAPTWRHLDRASGEPDEGQYREADRVFGATGAASLFVRAALDDVALDGEIFDSDFFAWREDAELCFRLQERGWEVVYEPSARCQHRRRVVPENRAQVPAVVNYHSLKNRYLLRAYHQTGRNFLTTFAPTLLRDLLACGYVLLRERSSLRAYGWLWRNRKRILARRRRSDVRHRRRRLSGGSGGVRCRSDLGPIGWAGPMACPVELRIPLSN